jgi:hypothetical protein
MPRPMMAAGGFSQARINRLYDCMAGYVERSQVPGVVTLLSRRGEMRVDAIRTKALGGGDPVGRRSSASPL